jgi:hypothetical protein
LAPDFSKLCDALAITNGVFGLLYFTLSILYFPDNSGFGVNSTYQLTFSQNDEEKAADDPT